MDEYTRKIIYYMNNQKYNKTLDSYDFYIEKKSLNCGDIVKFFVKIKDNKFSNLGYDLQGCSLNVFALEISCLFLQNKMIEEINQVTLDFFMKQLNFPSNKNHCIELVLDILDEIKTKLLI